jgi:hypothetical protein
MGTNGEEVVVVTSPQSPLGIEFPFKRRTPSRNGGGGTSQSSSPTIQREKDKGNVQSLLSLLKNAPPPAKTEITATDPETTQSTESIQSEQPISVEEKSVNLEGDSKIKSLLRVFQKKSPNSPETTAATVDPVIQKPAEEKGLGNEREKKLVAMLERALSKGVVGVPPS